MMIFAFGRKFGARMVFAMPGAQVYYSGADGVVAAARIPRSGVAIGWPMGY
jgi:hypothetical protein